MTRTPRTPRTHRIRRTLYAPLLALVVIIAAISVTLPLRARATDETPTPTPPDASFDTGTAPAANPWPEPPTPELPAPAPSPIITDTGTITATEVMASPAPEPPTPEPTASISATETITGTELPVATPTVTATATLTGTEVPAATPSPEPPTPTATVTDTQVPASPSGEAMPVGDLPGWKQIFAEDFTADAGYGEFPGTAYKGKFSIYKDGWADTAGQRGAPSRYYPSKVITVGNGMLNKYLHTENGTPMGAAILPILPGGARGQLYGKYTVRFRADSMRGFKAAWLLWPDVGGNRQFGEIDWPESDYASPMNGYMHHTDGVSGGDQDVIKSGTTYLDWHTASIEWTPGKVVFILDGRVIGTSTTRVPYTSLHWVLQSEACLPTCPAPETAGNVQIDWLTIYAPAAE